MKLKKIIQESEQKDPSIKLSGVRRGVPLDTGKPLVDRKLRVVMYLNHPLNKSNACTMYRNINPFAYLKDKVEVKYINDVKTEIETDKMRRKILSVSIDAEPIEWADIVVFSRHYDQMSIMGCLSEVAQKMGKPIVYETDDLLHKVEENIGEKHAYDERGIKKQLEFVNYILPRVDLVTVSSLPLKEFYDEQYHPKKSVVLPNCYDYKHWAFMRGVKKLSGLGRKRNVIRIGWQGGNNHFLKNFNYIVEPMNRIKAKYGDAVEFVVMSGQHPNVDVFAGEPEKRKFLNFDVEYHEGVELKNFPLELAKLDLDIGLIVVEDNAFSRAKSNIKWMEYSLLGVPSIASKCAPYLNTNALLVDNSEDGWFEAIDSLVRDKERRDKMRSEAIELVREYDIRNHSQEWLDAYMSILPYSR